MMYLWVSLLQFWQKKAKTPPLLMLWRLLQGQTLDAALAAKGYSVHDPSVLFSAPIAELAQHEVPRTTAFEIWKPLQPLTM